MTFKVLILFLLYIREIKIQLYLPMCKQSLKLIQQLTRKIQKISQAYDIYY